MIQLLREIAWVIVAGGITVSGMCEDDTGCNDDHRTHILLLVVWFFMRMMEKAGQWPDALYMHHFKQICIVFKF